MLEFLKRFMEGPKATFVTQKPKVHGAFGHQRSSRIARGLPVEFATDPAPPKKKDCSHNARYRTYLKTDGVRYKVACRACGKVVSSGSPRTSRPRKPATRQEAGSYHDYRRPVESKDLVK